MSDVFVTENFLLESDREVELFHRYAKDLPIIDYHCHLPVQHIAQDHRFKTMTEIWLYGDHYKWRLMRACGVAERFCTGDASDWEKFQKWAETVPQLWRNPLYHWTHMELKRPFGIGDRLLNPETSQEIWEVCNGRLSQPGFSARGIMEQMKVVLVCTTDDPADSLDPHAAIRKDSSFRVQVLPTFRPDKAMAPEDPEQYNAYLDKLSAAASMEIQDYDSLLAAVSQRHDFFHAMGCRLSDHGIETLYAETCTGSDAKSIFAKVRGRKPLDLQEILKLKSALLHEFAILDADKGWTQQFHVAALRNNNRRLFKTLGPDVGGDSMGDFEMARALSRFLGRLDEEGTLAKTIVYSLNPTHNGLLEAMMGNFQDGSVKGKMQLGSAWWFNDHLSGMLEQMEILSAMGVLSAFVGMLTDSRSFLSYARHDYFRRILCHLVGSEMKRGLLPNDMDLAGQMVRDISYFNAARYFGFEGLPKVSIER